MKTPDQLTPEDVLERKRRARSELARLPLVKKIEIVEELRKRLEPFKANRIRRKSTALIADLKKIGALDLPTRFRWIRPLGFDRVTRRLIELTNYGVGL